MIISHVKIIVFQTIIIHCLWIFYIARKDCSLYNKQNNTCLLGNTRFISRNKSGISAHPCIILYILFGLLIKIFEGTVISVVTFLITCFIFETLKDKEGQRHEPSSLDFPQKQLANIFYIQSIIRSVVEIQLNLHVRTSCVNCEVRKL